MNLSDAGARFIAGHEGLRLETYNDPAGPTSQQTFSCGLFVGGRDYSALPYGLQASRRNRCSDRLARHPVSGAESVRTLGSAGSLAPIACSPHRRDDLWGNALSHACPSSSLDLRDCGERFPGGSLVPSVRDASRMGYGTGDLRTVLPGSAQRALDRPRGDIGRTWCCRFVYVRNLARRAIRSIPSIRCLRFGSASKGGSLNMPEDLLAFEGAS